MLKDQVHLDIKQLTDVDGDIKQSGVDQQADHLVGATRRRQCVRCRRCRVRRPWWRLGRQLQTSVQQRELLLQVSELDNMALSTTTIRHVIQLQQQCAFTDILPDVLK